ncbi:MarR family winged helix-turn-helix transcriptional regulator [Agromyces albus]|uniref:MarR family transcriptional regulator n=1 Tax=Agromyces albus TaxID=205332 RepID=A0A4V1QXN3_9MICO|nr:MarR family transcriptional regulator [Agromyces albus]RXZ70256.1 MarR family transcriptional regulator [Agromyces albus]
MPRNKQVAFVAPFNKAATDPLVERAGFAASVESLVVWANSIQLRHRLMQVTDFPLPDDLLAFLVLNQLVYRGASRPTDMAEAVQTSTSNMTKVVKRLEEAGLVSRGPDPRDDRAIIIALSDAGRIAGHKIVGELDGLFRSIFERWSTEDRMEFERLAIKFTHDLDSVSEHQLSQISGVNWVEGSS